MQAARKPIGAVVVLFLAAWVVDAPTAVGQTTITVTANATDFSPNPVAAGSDSTSNLSATSSMPTPPAEATITGREWTWTLLLNGVSTYTPAQLALDQPSKTSATATLTANLSPGNYTITAQPTVTWNFSTGAPVTGTCDPITLTLNVVGVGDLQYFQAAPPGRGRYSSTGTYSSAVGQTLYVMAGKSITLQAIPNPTGAAWPDNQPAWSGTAGASGVGPSISVTPNTVSTSLTDTQTVVVTCGDTEQTTNLVVYNLLPQATPLMYLDPYPFPDRDLDAWGVCEQITLGFLTNPEGIQATTIGGLRWQHSPNGGRMPRDTLAAAGLTGTGTYWCPDTATSVGLIRGRNKRTQRGFFVASGRARCRPGLPADNAPEWPFRAYPITEQTVTGMADAI